MLTWWSFFHQEAFAWGPDGHRMIARLAVKNLPPDMPAFFTAASRQLMFLSFEPDEWRDPVEERLSNALRRGADPDHHFHLEQFDQAQLPGDRYSFFDALHHSGIEPQDVGVLPYRAMELFQRMRVSFRQLRKARADNDSVTAKFLEDRIIDDAGILSHYIGDASQPLHATVNHNGWETTPNPKGYTTDKTVHLRFEDTFVHSHIDDADVQPFVSGPRVVNDPLQYIYDEIRRAHNQVPALYDLEKAAPFGANDNDPGAKPFVSVRLADAASVLRDLWYTAYYTSANEQTSITGNRDKATNQERH
jgi:hypothetical protein